MGLWPKQRRLSSKQPGELSQATELQAGQLTARSRHPAGMQRQLSSLKLENQQAIAMSGFSVVNAMPDCAMPDCA